MFQDVLEQAIRHVGNDCGKMNGIKGNVDMNWMERDFWDIHMKEETTVGKMIADELILVLNTMES